MIVKCEQCQTRFKIPDEKVTEKGVKVRCTKCQHTFRVKREPASDGADPFASFGAAPLPPGSQATRPGLFLEGIAATRPPVGNVAPPAPPASEELNTLFAPASSRPTPIAVPSSSRPAGAPIAVPSSSRPMPGTGAFPIPVPTSSRSPSAALPPGAFDLDAGAPAPSGRGGVTAPLPQSRPPPGTFSQETTLPESRGRSQLLADVPDLGADERTAPGAGGRPKSGKFPAATSGAPGGAMSGGRAGEARSGAFATATTSPGAPPPFGGDSQPGLDPFAAAGGRGLESGGDPFAPTTLPGSGGPDPFAAARQGRGEPGDPHAPATLPSAGPNSGHFQALGRPGGAADPFAAARQGHGEPGDPFAPSTLPGAGPGGDPDPFAAMGGAAGFDASPAPDADPFAPTLGDAGQQDMSSAFGVSDDLAGDLGTPGAGDRGLFELPSRPAPAAAPPSARSAPAPAARPAQVVARMGTGSTPAATPTVPTEAPGPGAARRLSGLLVNLSIAAALLVTLATVGSVYLNEGKLDASTLSIDRVKGLLLSPREMIAVDVSNGLYETRRGRPIFYIRGEVQNRSGRTGPVKVRAEILDGSSLVRAAEGFAGATPTPEELYALSGGAEVEALAARLAKGARDVAAGENVPFLLLFSEYPSDLAAYRLRVTVVDGGSKPTAAR